MAPADAERRHTDVVDPSPWPSASTPGRADALYGNLDWHEIADDLARLSPDAPFVRTDTEAVLSLPDTRPLHR